MPDRHVLLVEVLSEGTEGDDREGTLRALPEPAEPRKNVFVSYRKSLIESPLPNPDGTWTTTFAGAGETLVLRSIDARLDVDEVYAGMKLIDGVMRLEWRRAATRRSPLRRRHRREHATRRR